MCDSQHEQGVEALSSVGCQHSDTHIMKDKNKRLQAMCCAYLKRMRYIAKKHGLSEWLNETLKATERNECTPTEHEVSILSRMVDDERLARQDVPKALGKTYSQCIKDNDFDKIKKLKRVGIYSKVSANLHKKNNDEDEQDSKDKE